MTPARTTTGRARLFYITVVTLAVAALVTASAIPVVGDPAAVAFARGSIRVVDDAGAPGSVLVSRELFASSPTAVVVAPTARESERRAAAEAARVAGVPVVAVDDTNSRTVAAELERLGVERAVRVGRVPALPVPVTDDVRVLAGGAATRGEGTVVLLSAAGDDAIATAEAAHAEVAAVPSPDPRSSGRAVNLVKARPGAPILAVGSGFGDPRLLARRVELARSLPELPGGGQLMFPGRRVVALYGSPGAPELGPLGRQSISASIRRAKAVAAQYDRLSPVPVVPGFEIIVTVASADPGPGGNYTSALDVAAVRPWVDAARKAGVYVTLDLQPGRMDFLDQAKMYRELLLQPHVGLALDPEWRLKPNQVHLQQIGSVSPAEVNRVSTWLADLVKSRNLPQKAFVLHQFDADMLGDRSKIDTSRTELAFLVHADGHGVPNVKMQTWNRIVAGLPPRTWLGWKNFYTEDKPMFSPRRTMNVDPVPWFVSYQ